MDEFVTLDELAEEEEAERHDSRSRDKGSSGSAFKYLVCPAEVSSRLFYVINCTIVSSEVGCQSQEPV